MSRGLIPPISLSRDLFSPSGDQAIFSTFWGDLLTELHCQPGEKIHWRNSINPMETAPPEFQFLSLVVVEGVLADGSPIKLQGQESWGTPKIHLQNEISPKGSETKWPNRYNPVALRSRATLFCSAFSRIWRGVAGESRYTFSALERCVAVQVASWKVSRYRGCRSYTVARRTAVGH